MNMHEMLMIILWDVNACLTPRGVTDLTPPFHLSPFFHAHPHRTTLPEPVSPSPHLNSAGDGSPPGSSSAAPPLAMASLFLSSSGRAKGTARSTLGWWTRWWPPFGRGPRRRRDPDDPPPPLPLPADRWGRIPPRTCLSASPRVRIAIKVGRIFK
jgi:hypothetical protein